MGIFDKRVAFKPFEYPDVMDYADAINNSFWVFKEWNFLGDIHDFNVKLENIERNAIKNALLAISQIEVDVKRFWGKLGDRFPKAEFDFVGGTFSECFIDGTEILTPSGWKNLKDISVGDEIIQFNADNTLNITKVQHKTDQQYDGDMYRLHKKTTEVIVTPNHRLIYYKKGVIQESVVAKVAFTNSDLKLPEAARLSSTGFFSSKVENSYLSFIDRLRIVIQADGNRRYYNNGCGRKLRQGNGMGAEYEVRIQKQRKINRLDWILENIEGINFSKREINSRPGMYCYTIRIDDNYDYKSFDWVNLTSKDYWWCLDFIEEIAEWDGTRLPEKKDCKIKFSSTNKKVADTVQMVGVGAGYRTNLIVHKDDRKPTFNDVYIVSFTSNRERIPLPSLKSEVINYNGTVRCVTVESGMLVTRYNNKTFISGNSEVRHARAYSHLLEILGLNDDFAELLENPVIQGRVDYLTKYLKGASENSNENYTLTLTLFSLFIENVSLFSQFLVIKSFNKHRNILKDIDNVVQATQREEQIHALFGVYIIKQIQKECPDWFHEGFYHKLTCACLKAYDAESRIIDWIFEQGELSFLPKAVVKEFTKQRFNDSLEMVGAEKVFDVNPELLEQVKWFDEELDAEVNTDFFHKKPITYSKKMQAIKAEDIF